MTLMRMALIATMWMGISAAAPPSTTVAHADVPLGTILQNPAAYNGRAVRAHGFLIIQYEGNSLWATEADFRAERYDRAAWIDLPPGMTDHDRMNGRRVFVSGVIVSGGRGHGHMGMWPARLSNVQDVTADPTDTEPSRPWLTDPLFTILAALGLLGLFFASVTVHARAQRATQRRP